MLWAMGDAAIISIANVHTVLSSFKKIVILFQNDWKNYELLDGVYDDHRVELKNKNKKTPKWDKNVISGGFIDGNSRCVVFAV